MGCSPRPSRSSHAASTLGCSAHTSAHCSAHASARGAVCMRCICGASAVMCAPRRGQSCRSAACHPAVRRPRVAHPHTTPRASAGCVCASTPATHCPRRARRSGQRAGPRTRMRSRPRLQCMRMRMCVCMRGASAAHMPAPVPPPMRSWKLALKESSGSAGCGRLSTREPRAASPPSSLVSTASTVIVSSARPAV